MISHALNMENMGKKLFEAGSHVVPTVLDLIYVTQYDLEPLTFCFLLPSPGIASVYSHAQLECYS